MPLSEPNVERYLEENPAFLQKFVVQHLSETDIRELYEHWFQAHGRKLSNEKERKRSRTEEEGRLQPKSSVTDNKLLIPSLSAPPKNVKFPNTRTTLDVPTEDSGDEAMDITPTIKRQQILSRQFRKTISREGAPILKPYRSNHEAFLGFWFSRNVFTNMHLI
eukprot:sb/3472719/